MSSPELYLRSRLYTKAAETGLKIQFRKARNQQLVSFSTFKDMEEYYSRKWGK